MFEQPKLDYAYDALEPHIDAKTMEIHYSKHHKAYVDNYNKFVAGIEWDKMKIEDVIRNIGKVPENIRTPIKNHGGGAYNHALFWKFMAPNAGGSPGGALADAISKKWGSFDKFKEEFNKAGMGRFGSGWAWLVLTGNELEITSTANQDSPLSEGKTPLLGNDVWEHSYYLKYQNRRADYLTAWWNVVHWDYVTKNYDSLMH